MTTATVAIRRNQNLYRQKTKLQLGPVSASIITVAVISVLALLYLNQITKTSIYGYRSTQLSTMHDKLAASKQELQVEAARLQSIQQVESSPVVAGMVPETTVSFAK